MLLLRRCARRKFYILWRKICDSRAGLPWQVRSVCVYLLRAFNEIRQLQCARRFCWPPPVYDSDPCGSEERCSAIKTPFHLNAFIRNNSHSKLRTFVRSYKVLSRPLNVLGALIHLGLQWEDNNRRAHFKDSPFTICICKSVSKFGRKVAIVFSFYF